MSLVIQPDLLAEGIFDHLCDPRSCVALCCGTAGPVRGRRSDLQDLACALVSCEARLYNVAQTSRQSLSHNRLFTGSLRFRTGTT